MHQVSKGFATELALFFLEELFVPFKMVLLSGQFTISIMMMMMVMMVVVVVVVMPALGPSKERYASHHIASSSTWGGGSADYNLRHDG